VAQLLCRLRGASRHHDHLFSGGHVAPVGRHQYDLNTYLHPLADGAKDHGHGLRRSGTIEKVGVEQHGDEVHGVALSLEFFHESGREELPVRKAVLVRDYHEPDIGAGDERRGLPGGRPPGGRHDHLADAALPSAAYR
jgi:hypothetical protein